MIKLRFIWIGLAIGLTHHACVSACQQSDPNVAEVAYLQDISRLSNDELSAALKELRSRTQQLESQIRQDLAAQSAGSQGSSTTQEPAPHSAGSGSTNRSTAPVNGSTNRSAATTGVADQKIEEIERNIRLLQEIYREKRLRSKKSEPPATPTPGTAGSENRSSIPDPDVNGSGAKNGLDPARSGSHAKGSSNRNGGSGNKSLKRYSRERVVSSIVDPFELGNSLFRSGNIEQALKYYEVIAEDQLTDYERHWLYLMRASCYRATGDIEKAEAAYRGVANAKIGERVANTAKGWLKYIASKKKVDSLVEEYTKRADVVLKQAETVLEANNGR